MKNVFLSLSFALFLNIICSGQHLIGVSKDIIAQRVKTEMKGFNLDNSSKNKNYNYLKYLNSSGTKTLFIFFNENNISTNTRLVCDYSELDFVLDDLKKQFKKAGENKWEYTVGKGKFLITMRKEEWYFVVSTKKK